MVTAETILLTLHATRRKDDERIGVQEIVEALNSGITIEDYPTDTPYPSRLVLGWVTGRPIHVVTATHPESGHAIIITTYRPKPDRWDAAFRTRVR